MSNLLKESKKLFGTNDLYAVLDIDRTASAAAVKKAYYKLSLSIHPDRVENNKSEATAKFQTLGKIYSILSDKDKRSVYNESGSVDDEDFESDRDWSDYWRILFPKIDSKAIHDFEQRYKGSAEELEDIKSAYVKCEGDMDKMMSSIILCSDIDDEPRFRSIINDLIEKRELPEFKAFTNETPAKRLARKRKAEKEEKEATKALKKMKTQDGSGDLAAMIRRNNETRGKEAEGFFKKLIEKYGNAEEEEEEEQEEEEEEEESSKSKKKSSSGSKKTNKSTTSKTSKKKSK